MYKVLPSLLKLYKEVVRLPINSTPEEITNNPKRYPFFADCIRALDGTHLPISVPGGYIRQAPWRRRKGGLSQNVLIVVNFQMNFLYVLASWEGSTHDSRVINSAKAKGFKASPSRYYVADTRYSNTPITLTPYRGVWYHLHKQAQANTRLQNAKELFNLRHSALRNIVERTIGVFKNRFRYFKAGRHNLPLSTQVDVVYALAAVYNFININNPDNLDGDLEVEDKVINKEDAGLVEAEGDVVINQRRNEIAELIWESYCQVIGRPI